MAETTINGTELKDSELEGLNSEQAQRLLRSHGENVIYRKSHMRPLVAFAKKFNSPLILILVGAAALSFFLGQRTNALIIFMMILLSATLDFWNSYWSEKAIEKLTAKVTTTATVLRDGSRREAPFKFIVPGDIIFLSAGDVIPADGAVLAARDFFVNESALTGESYPAEKSATAPRNTVKMGTSVLTGYATAKITTTGSDTEYGKIAEDLAKAAPETDFERGIKEFSYFITKVTFVLVIFVFFVNAFFGKGIFNSLLFAIAIAIGLTPELLPVIMSVALGRGSARMAKKDVIVKNLSAIQSFGSMNILCTDKTGTLTEGKIKLVRYVDGFGKTFAPVLRLAYVSSKFHTAVRSPLDAAIAEYGPPDISGYEKVDEIPFDFERKRDSVAVKSGATFLMITKGAPEEILKISAQYRDSEGARPMTDALRSDILAEFESLSAEGFRVLGVAEKELPPGQQRYAKEDESAMIFYGFVAFLDPAKTTVAEALSDLRQLGVETKVLTGDSEILTQKICHDIGLEVRGVITGDELEQMSEDELMRRAGATTIFARVRPRQKEIIILALKKSGAVAGYLGDGINDAPALKAADVGISVNNAVDIAKETADLVLLRKSLRVLRDGIVEGRITYHNTMKYITMGLSSNFGNMFSMTLASLFLPFLPMLPVQILLNNFLYDVSQLALAGDKVDKEDISKPQRWDLPAIKKFMVVFGSVSSVFDLITFAMLFLVFGLRSAGFQTGWFMESLATQIFVIYIIRTKKLPIIGSRPSGLIIFNTLLAAAAGWLIPFTFMGRYFNFHKIPVSIILGIALIVVVYLAAVEVTKHIFYRKRKAAVQTSH